MIRKAKSSYDRRIAEKKFRWSQELLESCEESPSPNPNKSVTPQPSASSWVYHSTWKNNHACPYYCERFLLKVSAVVSASILQMLWRNCYLTPLKWNQLSSEACLYNSSQSLLSLKPVSAAFVNRRLRLLKTSKGTGRNSSPSPSISASAVVSEEWKYARVVSLCKDGDTEVYW